MKIYVATQEINDTISCPFFHAARVEQIRNVIIDGSWDFRLEGPTEARAHGKKAVLDIVSERVRSGASWAEAGAYDRLLSIIEEIGEFDGCRTLEDVEKRYRRLDCLIDDVRRAGRIKSIREIQPIGFREVGGIHVAITRAGVFAKVGGGTHRFAIARELGLPFVPACLDTIHPVAIKSGAWKEILLRSRQFEKSDRKKILS